MPASRQGPADSVVRRETQEGRVTGALKLLPHNAQGRDRRHCVAGPLQRANEHPEGCHGVHVTVGRPVTDSQGLQRGDEALLVGCRLQRPMLLRAHTRPFQDR
jgi:hypothetical protein